MWAHFWYWKGEKPAHSGLWPSWKQERPPPPPPPPPPPLPRPSPQAPAAVSLYSVAGDLLARATTALYGSTPNVSSSFSPLPTRRAVAEVAPGSLQSPPATSHEAAASKVNVAMVVGIAAAAVVLVSALCMFAVFLLRRRRSRTRLPRQQQQQPSAMYKDGTPLPAFQQAPAEYHFAQKQRPSPPQTSGTFSESVSDYQESGDIVIEMPRGTHSYEQLAAAANGFSSDNLIGEGGFGRVYMGTLDGNEVAIKRLRSESRQGDREFRAEVEIISRVHHRNLVSLVGYCIYSDERLLVYEFVPNKTLDSHLHGNNGLPLHCQQRWKIALGSAKGLAYLHDDCHPKIIHRDVKASNILLDHNFEPKVADFGLAKYQAGDRTHVSTRVMGTFGYIAPEFVSSGKLTDRADVFAFGVVLLELITGKPPIQSSQSYMDETLVAWARPLLPQAMEDGNLDGLIDPRLGGDYDPSIMTRMIECAAAAVHQSAHQRPSMSQIVKHLQGDTHAHDLNSGIRIANSSSNESHSSSFNSMYLGGGPRARKPDRSQGNTSSDCSTEQSTGDKFS